MDLNNLHYIHPAHSPHASQENLNSEHWHTLSRGIYQPQPPNTFRGRYDFQPAGELAERENLGMTYPPRVTASASSSQTIPVPHTSSLTQVVNGGSPITQSLEELNRYMYLYQESCNDMNSPEVHSSQSHTTPWNTQILPDSGTYGEVDTMLPVIYRQPLVDPAGSPPDIEFFAATLGHGDDSALAFQRLSGYHKIKNEQQRFECFRDCRWRRFGLEGFKRRANLLAHLRSCHGQEISKQDRHGGRGRGKSIGLASKV